MVLIETKLRRRVIQYDGIGSDKYNVFQIRSTVLGRGGLAVPTKKGLQLMTSEVVREEEGDYFIEAVVLKSKRNKAIFGWYNSLF